MISSLSPTPVPTNPVAQAVSASTAQAAAPAFAGGTPPGATPSASSATDAARKPTPKPQPDTRLTIEESADGRGYVYTLVDRLTGKTISQVPREQIADLAASGAYAAGQVARTRA